MWAGSGEKRRRGIGVGQPDGWWCCYVLFSYSETLRGIIGGKHQERIVMHALLLTMVGLAFKGDVRQSLKHVNKSAQSCINVYINYIIWVSLYSNLEPSVTHLNLWSMYIEKCARVSSKIPFKENGAIAQHLLLFLEFWGQELFNKNQSICLPSSITDVINQLTVVLYIDYLLKGIVQVFTSSPIYQHVPLAASVLHMSKCYGQRK